MRVRTVAVAAIAALAGAGCACTPQPVPTTPTPEPEASSRQWVRHPSGCIEVIFDGLGLDYRGAGTVGNAEPDLGEWWEAPVNGESQQIGFALAEDSAVWINPGCARSDGLAPDDEY